MLPTVNLSRSEARRVARGIDLLVRHYGGQKAAADAINVSHGTMGSLLKGRVTPRNQRTLEAVARALGCSLAALLVEPSRLRSVGRDERTALAAAAKDAYERAGGEGAAPWPVFALSVAGEGGAVDARTAGGYVQCLLQPVDAQAGHPDRLWQALDDASRAPWIEAAKAVDEAAAQAERA